MIDLLYSLYIVGDHESLKRLITLPISKEIQKNCFSIEFLKELEYLLSIKLDSQFNQEEIDLIFTDIALFFHRTGDYTFLLNRGITQQTIDRFKLGSTKQFETNSYELEEFIFNLKQKYIKDLIEYAFLDYHLFMFETNLRLYKDPYCVTIPTFDNNGICRGIVYRTEKYYPRTDSIRNLYKFYNSHAPSYIFNLEAVYEYDTLLLVEGVFDALSIYQLGFENVISVSHTKLSKYHIELLKDKNIIMLTDNDMGGLSGLEYFYEHYHNSVKSIKYYQLKLDKDIDLFIRNKPEKAREYLTKLLS